MIMCFAGADGRYLGPIQDPSLPMSTPLGIALGADRRLLVAAQNSERINIFGLEGYVSMGAAPLTLTFLGKQGMPNPAEQSLTISNSGTGTLTYRTASATDWIVLHETGGSAGPGGTGTLAVGVNITGLVPATYHGTVAVTDTVSGFSENIDVTLEVKAVPQLSVSTGTLSYGYISGGAVPASKTVTITLANDTEGSTTWTAVSDSGWLSISPSVITGNSITTAKITVKPSGLVPGTYTGHIGITAPGATGSPAEIIVTLKVKLPGQINVNCNIAQAAFRITGPVNYEGSGTSWTTVRVPKGTYTITYQPVTGYKAPSPETKQLTAGAQISFEGTYRSLAMSASIIVSRPGTIPGQAGIGIFNGNGELMNSFAPGYAGKVRARTAVGDIDGDGKADIVCIFSAQDMIPGIRHLFPHIIRMAA